MTKRQKAQRGERYTPPRPTRIVTAAMGVTALVATGGQLIGAAGSAPAAGAATAGLARSPETLSPRADLPNGTGYWLVGTDGGSGSGGTGGLAPYPQADRSGGGGGSNYLGSTTNTSVVNGENATSDKFHPANGVVTISNAPPAITSAPSTAFTVGQPGSFTATASGVPAPTISETGTLPTGVTLTAAGVLSGTPAAGTAGTYPITLVASNGVAPDATQAFSLTVQDIPGAPSGVTATAGPGEIVLSWSPPAVPGVPPLTGYVVFRGTTPGGSEIAYQLTSASSFTDTDVIPSVTYFYTVAAINAVGLSTPSNEASATVALTPAGVALAAGGARLAALPDASGYWVVGPAGSLTAYGNAKDYGSMAGKALNAPVVGIAATPDGQGYWLVGADGGVFAFGDAGFYGSMAGKALNAPVVGIAATPDGQGYWLVGADGGVFAFGDAGFYGSMAGKAQPTVIGLVALSDGQAYELVDTSGGATKFAP